MMPLTWIIPNGGVPHVITSGRVFLTDSTTMSANTGPFHCTASIIRAARVLFNERVLHNIARVIIDTALVTNLCIWDFVTSLITHTSPTSLSGLLYVAPIACVSVILAAILIFAAAPAIITSCFSEVSSLIIAFATTIIVETMLTHCCACKREGWKLLDSCNGEEKRVDDSHGEYDTIRICRVRLLLLNSNSSLPYLWCRCGCVTYKPQKQNKPRLSAARSRLYWST